MNIPDPHIVLWVRVRQHDKASVGLDAPTARALAADLIARADLIEQGDPSATATRGADS